MAPVGHTSETAASCHPLREGPLRSHIRAALHIGFTQEQVIEVFLHFTLYGGIAFARGAIDIANGVFAHG